MKTGLAMLVVLVCLPRAAEAAEVACRSGATESVAQVSSPPRGSPERKAMLGVLRRFVKNMSSLDVVFVVGHIQSACGWAWIETDPQSADGTQHYEPVHALLARRNGRWQYVQGPPEWAVCEPDPDCVDRARWFRKLVATHPGLPAAIFPAVTPDE